MSPIGFGKKEERGVDLAPKRPVSAKERETREKTKKRELRTSFKGGGEQTWEGEYA